MPRNEPKEGTYVVGLSRVTGKHLISQVDHTVLVMKFDTYTTRDDFILWLQDKGYDLFGDSVGLFIEDTQEVTTNAAKVLSVSGD